MVKKETILWLVSNQAWSRFWVSKHWIAYLESKQRQVIYVSPFKPTNNPLKWTNFDIKEVGDNIVEIKPFSPKGFYRLPLKVRVVFISIFHGRLKSYINKEHGNKPSQLLSFDTTWSLSNVHKFFFEHIYYPVDPPMGWGREEEDILAHKNADRSFCISSFRSAEIKRKFNMNVEVIPHAVCDVEIGSKNKSIYNKEFANVANITNKGLVPVCYVGSLNAVCFDIIAVKKLLDMNEDVYLVVYCPLEATELSGFDSSLLLEHERIDYRGSLDFEYVNQVTALYRFGFIPYDIGINNKWEMRSPFKAANYLAAGVPFISANVPASSDYVGVAVFYDSLENIAECVAALSSSAFTDNYHEKREAILAQRKPEVIIKKLFSL